MIGDSRYQIEGEIARGGMGVVLRVKDGDLDRTLAMKRMASAPDETMGGAEADRFARFMEEAQVTAQLDHPAIVPVHDLGFDEDGTGWYTMKLVEGRELGEVFELARAGKEGWSEAGVLRVLEQVCQAVAYAHGKGVIHRDLKPSNIMVGEFGEVYVMDWGLSRVEGSEVTSPRKDDEISGSAMTTLHGSVMGTPHFMSPEQARGEEADERSDVYAVGAVMHLFLAGKPAYEGEGKEVVKGVVERGPEPLQDGVRRELAKICEKAMARKREGRYQTMGELAEDLRRYLDGRVVLAHESGGWAEFKKWVGRNKAVTGALGVVFLTLVGMLVLQGIAKKKISDSESGVIAALERLSMSQGLNAGTSLEYGKAAYWYREAAMLAADEERAQTHRVRALIADDRQTAPVRALMVPPIDQGHCRLDFSPDGLFLLVTHSFDNEVKQVVDVREEVLVKSSDGGVFFKGVAFCAKTGRVALVPRGNPARCEVWSRGFAEMLEAFDTEGDPVSALAFSPDGGKLFVGGERGRLYDFSRQDFGEQMFVHLDGRAIGFAAFDPMGELLMTVLHKKEVEGQEYSGLRVFDVAGAGEPLYPVRECWFWPNLAEPAFFKDGTSILYYPEAGRMAAMVARTGKVLFERDSIPTDVRLEDEQFVNGGGDYLRSGSERKIDEDMGVPRFRPHHESVLANRPYLREISWVDGTLRRPVGLNRYEVRFAAVSPDGMLAAGWESDGLLRFWSLQESEWQFEANIFGEVVYSPSGRWITSTGGSTRIVYEVENGMQVGSGMDFERESVEVVFSPDERYLAVGLKGGQVEFWDWREGVKIAASDELPGEVLTCDYTRDGEWLAVMCRSGELCRVEPGSGRVTVLMKTGKVREQVAAPRHLKGMEFSANGRWLVVWSVCEGVVVWDCELGKQAPSPPVRKGWYVGLLKMCGNRIVFIEEDDFEQVFLVQDWDLETRQWAREALDAGRGYYSNLDVSEDGNRILLSRSGEEYGSLAEQDGRGVWRWRKIQTMGRAASFLVPGTPFAVGVTSSGPSRLVKVDLRDGSALASPLSNEVSRFHFPKLAPDGKSLAAIDWTGSGLVKVWDISVLTEDADEKFDDAEDRQMLSELNAGGRDSEVGWTELKGEEWLSQWEAFREKHPDWHQVPQCAGARMSADAFQ